MTGSNSTIEPTRILGRVPRQEFVGRGDELKQIVRQAEVSGRGMLILMAPSAGVSELLRQAYDQIFNQHSEVVPIYFAFARDETTAVSAAIEFLNAFLQQYVAFRRNEPALCLAALTLQDIVALAPPADLDWIEKLVDAYTRQRFTNDDKALVRFCLSAPQRIPTRAGRAFIMMDGSELAENLNGAVVLGTEVLRVFDRNNSSFVLAGLRRQIFAAAHDAGCNFEKLDLLHLSELDTLQAHQLVENVARRQRVQINDESSDLLVQQFSRNPFFITSFVQAAREKGVALTSYLDCQRLYVDEILGGHLQRYFAALLEEIAPAVDTRQALVRLLWEAAAGDEQIATFETWRKRLQVDVTELESILHRLHVRELVNWDEATVEVSNGLQPWKDYLKIRYRLDVLNEIRVLVVAEALADALKRAPHTMARHYRKLAQVGLRQLLERFDCQHVPTTLLDYRLFSERFRGAADDEVLGQLEADNDLFRLPQVVHVASCAAFNIEMRQVCDDDRCVVAHCFDGAVYSDAQQIIWLAVVIDSKLEVDEDLAQLWQERLASLAGELGLRRYQIWLISNAGFTEEAMNLMHERDVFTSNRRQLELLAARLSDRKSEPTVSTEDENEFLIVLPMGEDNELLAASTVEQMARRMGFRPEAINQIKTAIVEACINASEHSLSPDRKIYQRFRVESDKLVITISSRGIAPTNLGSPGASVGASDFSTDIEERRGWGLKLIRTLMDEVEFERVDEGTSLRMTKYLRNT